MFLVTDRPIDADAVRRAVESPRAGAVVLFHGTVRDHTGARVVTRLHYEAYEPMAVRQMERIGQDVATEYGLTGLACTHRLGALAIGEVAIVVGASAPHRAAALEGIEAFVARLKQDVPIWKQEHFEGGAVWIGTPDDPQGARQPAPEGAR